MSDATDLAAAVEALAGRRSWDGLDFERSLELIGRAALTPAEPVVPNPGSREAGERGCICPVMDNWHGADELGRIRGFVVVEGCPLHALTDPLPAKDSSRKESNSVE